MDVAHGEMVEKELTRMIEKRSRKEPDPDELAPAYAESVRRYNAARLKERRAEWYAYHADQAERLRRTMEPLIAFHEARAAALCEESRRGEGVR
jgi:hypothetical protein